MRKTLFSLLAAFAVLAVQPSPSFATADPEVWVTQQDTSAIAVVQGGRVAARIKLPAGAGPHTIEFSPSGKFAYVSAVDNGALYVIDVRSRSVVTTLSLGKKGTHQARPTPDGTRLLVAQIAAKQVVLVAADEGGRTWRKRSSVQLTKEPICTAYSKSGDKAFVSMKPDGIAVIDVSAMRLVRTLPTDGQVQCGLAEMASGDVYVSANGSGGRLYRLDSGTNRLRDLVRSFGAKDIHGLALDQSESTAYLSARESDALKIVALPDGPVATVSLDRRPGTVDKPDSVAVAGDTVYVAMRTSGDVALVNRRTRAVRYINLAPPSPNAVHGVAVRGRSAGAMLARTGAAASIGSLVAFGVALSALGAAVVGLGVTIALPQQQRTA